jgi:hypothetical protein
MIHPSIEAEEYIWNKFSTCYFDDSTKDFVKHWKSLFIALQHKPFHSQTASHQSFLKKTLLQLEELNKTVDVTKEIASVKSQITLIVR